MKAKVIARDYQKRILQERLENGEILTYVYTNHTEEEEFRTESWGGSYSTLYVTTFDSKGNIIAEETHDGHLSRYRYDKNGTRIDQCFGDERFPARFLDEPGALSLGW